jgi:hypothetical protein
MLVEFPLQEVSKVFSLSGVLSLSKLFVLHQGAHVRAPCYLSRLGADWAIAGRVRPRTPPAQRAHEEMVEVRRGAPTRDEWALPSLAPSTQLCSLSSSHGLRELGLLREVGDDLCELEGG